MNNGWIKLHRKLLLNPIMLNADLLQLFIYCLLKANHSTKKIIWNGNEIEVKIGSFISGIHVICEDLNQKQTSTFRRLQTLQELGYISVVAENKFSVITVLKYNSYQILIEQCGKQTENKRKTNGKQTETNNNDNNKKNDNKGLHLFANSPYNELTKFKEAFYSNPKYLKYDYTHYYEAVKNWSESSNKKKANWIATAYTWARNDKTPHLLENDNWK